MKISRVLVTGARGHVGREVVRACAAAGILVRAADRSAVRVDGAAEAVAFDFRDRTTWAAALAGCDGVFLLRPPAIADTDTTLVPFVDAARAAGARHLVFLSVLGADKMRWIPHRAVEARLAAGPDDWTILRAGFFAQNFEDAYLRDVVEDGRVTVPAGDARVAFVDAADLGDATARILTEPEAYAARVLDLTGPDAITFAQATEVLGRALGRPLRYQAASLAGYARHLRRRGLGWMPIAVQTILHAGLRRGDAARVDPTLAQVLGRPARSFEAYARRCAIGHGADLAVRAVSGPVAV